MNRKEFLKPNKQKVLFTLALLILSIVNPFIFPKCFDMVAGEHPAYCKLIIDGLWTVIFQRYGLLLVLQTTPLSSLVLSFVISLAGYYTFSCLLFWLYDKIRKK